MSSPALQSLSRARAIADYAERLGISATSTPQRSPVTHIGAALADAVLQAGVNYQTVVRPRVERIEALYPDASKLSGVIQIVAEGGASDLLRWRHPAKITRFVHLVWFLGNEGVECTGDLRRWLVRRDARGRFLELHGIGPKTYDYICCLTGIDCIAVDRHVKTFAIEAGVLPGGYEELQMAMSFAADLLGIARRDFDAWIWQRLSRNSESALQSAYP